jgi:TolB protein
VPRHVFVADADGSDRTDLGLGSNPAWSPDGTEIAFTLWPDIWVMNADGTQRRQVTDDPSSTHRVGEPTWSPDGTQIAFNANNQDIWVVNVAAGAASQTEILNYRTLRVTVGELAWSSLSDKILFGTSDIWSINPNGSNPINLTNTPDKYERYPDWKPDGTRIVFERGQPEEIWTMDPDGTDQVNITPVGGANAVSHPAWSPDGTKVVFTWGGIRIMNPDGTGATSPLIVPGIAPDWQPLETPPPTSTTIDDTTTTTEATTTTTTVPTEGALDIDDTASSDGDVMQVTGTIRCDEGLRFRIEVMVTQADTAGEGVGTGTCTGATQSFRLKVLHQSGPAFEDGPASVEATGEIGNPGSRTVIDTFSTSEEVTVEIHTRQAV